MMLSTGQKAVLNRIRPIAKLALDKTKVPKLPLKLRTHSLICGPSGIGKSHLCRALGKALGAEVLVINVSSWSVINAKTGPYSWDTILDFIHAHDRGIIVLDEVDKIDGQGEWQGHIRLEIHDLLDGIIPHVLSIPGSVSESDWEGGFWEEISEEKPKLTQNQESEEARRKALETKLKDHYFIIGAGAWHHLWQNRAKPALGFGANYAADKMQTPSEEEIRSSIYPELLRRFRSEIAIIPPMTKDDYLDVAVQVYNTLEPQYQTFWIQNVASKTDELAELHRGMRYFEEMLLETLLNPEPDRPKLDPSRFVLTLEDLPGLADLAGQDEISQEDFAKALKQKPDAHHP